MSNMHRLGNKCTPALCRVPLLQCLAAAAAMAAAAVLHCASQRAVGPVGPDGRQLTWSEMSFQQRRAHMKSAVIPAAAPIFRAWRPQRFATIGCALCHGDAERTGDFRMPTDHLPRLSGEVLLGHERANFPETTQLKLDRLVPAVAGALGMDGFNIITRRGFGCYSCHLGPRGPMFGH